MGRQFPATRRILIDVATGELILQVNNKQVLFNIFKAMEYPRSTYDYFELNVVQQMAIEK